MFAQILLGLLTVFVLSYFKSFVSFLVDLRHKLHLTRHMTGPDSLPLIGSLHVIPRDHKKLLQFLVDESHKALAKGEDVMKFWIGPKLVIMPFENESIRAITTSSVEINKGVDYQFFEKWLGTGLLLGSGERWHRIRRMVTPTFHFGRIDEYSVLMDLHTRKMIELLQKRANEQEVDLYPYIKLCSLDIIADCAMGIQLNAQEDSSQPYVKAVETFNYLGFLLSFNPQYYFFGGIFWKLMGYEAQTQNALKVLKEFSEKIVKERMETFNDVKENQYEVVEKKQLNFLDLMLENQAENQISMEELRAEVDTFLFAGHDTTSHAVSWTLWCLATHPEVQQKLHAEIVEHFGQSDSEFHTRKIKDLTYLEQVFKESMRQYAPVPLLQRTLINDLQMGKHVAPAGTAVGIAPFIIHHNPQVFPDPFRFDPERFAPGREYPAHMYIPFLSGPRSCVGQKFASRECKTMVAHLIYNFEFSTSYRMDENPGLPEVVLTPKLGIPVTMRARC